MYCLIVQASVKTVQRRADLRLIIKQNLSKASTRGRIFGRPYSGILGQLIIHVSDSLPRSIIKIEKEVTKMKI